MSLRFYKLSSDLISVCVDSRWSDVNERKYSSSQMINEFQMMTSSNGNFFRVTGPLCWNSPVPVNSPHKGQWRGTFMFPLICTLDKRLSKQSWGKWFETLSRPLWRHWNEKQFCGTAPDTARLEMSTLTQNSEATILLPVNLLTPWYFIRILDKLF